jgi:hypothetical protein
MSEIDETHIDDIIRFEDHEWDDENLTVSYAVIAFGSYYQTKVDKIYCKKEYFKRKLKGR